MLPFAALAALTPGGWHLQRPRHAVLNTPQSGLVGRLANTLTGCEGQAAHPVNVTPAIGTP